MGSFFHVHGFVGHREAQKFLRLRECQMKALATICLSIRRCALPKFCSSRNTKVPTRTNMVGRHRTFAKTRAAQHPPNRPSVYTLDYSSCSNDELRRFIRDRSRDPTMDLQGPPMKQTRAGVKSEESRTQMFLISILEKLDEETTFRFLDLPAEMRNVSGPAQRQRLLPS